MKEPITLRAVLETFLILFFAATLAIAQQPLEPQFSPQTHPFPGMRLGSFGWADFDNDGDLDVFVCGSVDGPIATSFSRVYRNDGGSFVNTEIVLPAYRSGSADWTDFDNDGYLDLVLTGLTDYDPLGTRVFRNLGGTNLVQFALLPEVFDGRAAWGDFNQDGYPDLIITGNYATAGPFLTRVFVNNRGTNFTQFAALSPEFYYGTADWADYDHDGDLDLLVTGETFSGSGSGAYVFRNDNGHFTALEPIARTSGVSGQWFDANNDGWPDLLLLMHSDAKSSVFINNKAGGFARSADLSMLGIQAVGDVNNDGFNDALIVGYRYSTPIGNFVFEQNGLYLNSGLGTWLERTNLIPNLQAAMAAWGDYDRDGRLDLILHGQHAANRQISYTTYLYRNITPRTNEPPTAPGELTVKAESGGVWLSWNEATDSNQAGGLTYNVRFGTAAGRGDVVNAMSAPDGWRRVVKRGNAEGRTSFFLRDLQPRRTYYWSVQSIDNSFSGSAFAPEASFTFIPPPAASNQVVVLDEDTPQPITLTGADAEGAPLRFIIIAPPTNGTLTGAAPNLVYTPNTNFYGPDGFTFKVVNGSLESAPASVRISVLPVNDPPNADASATAVLWLSGNGTNAVGILDGSRSTDVDGPRLEYTWRAAGATVPMARGEIALVRLPVGTNLIDLTVSDGLATDTDRVAVEVLTVAQAVERLVTVLTESGAHSQALIASLSAAIASIDRGNPGAAVNQLQSFQSKLRTQVAPQDPDLANKLIDDAQAVIDSLTNPAGPALFLRVIAPGPGRGTHVVFEAARGGRYLIEASENLNTWTTVGPVQEQTEGLFQFEDFGSDPSERRFYRVRSP